MLNGLLEDLKLFLILTLISIFLVTADNFNFLNLPKSLVQFISSPIQYGLYKTGQSVSKQFDFIFLARRSVQENKALKEQLTQILSENANLRRRLGEAQGFLAQQQALSPQIFTLVAARPIGLARYLFIDKGSDDGIKLNQAVIYKDNYLGKIKEVSSKRSQVMLSSDPDSKLSAFAQNQDGRSRGVLTGQFGSEMLLDKILHQEPAAKGDLVYSEGTEIEIPRGLILGQIIEVEERENEIFKQAKVKPIFEATDLDVLFVITN